MSRSRNLVPEAEKPLGNFLGVFLYSLYGTEEIEKSVSCVT
jgi:hypothetical protein